MDEYIPTDKVGLATSIVSAYVSHNAVNSNAIPQLIKDVHNSLVQCEREGMEPQKVELIPAVPIKKSVTPDYLICLEDGKKFKSMRRHLRELGMTPEQYREKWGLPLDYPMVAPNYANARSELAKKMGLGKR